MNLVHVVLAVHAVAARLWRAGPGHDASPARLRRAGPGRGLAAVARHAGPGQNGPRPGPVGGPEHRNLAQERWAAPVRLREADRRNRNRVPCLRAGPHTAATAG